MSDELNFSTLDLIEVPVTIDGKKYTLREMSLATGIKLRNAQTEAAVVKDGKIAGTRGVAHMEPQIISECLFDEQGNKVPQDVILKWGDKICRTLYAKIRQISGYDVEKEVAAIKKELDAARKREESRKNS